MKKITLILLILLIMPMVYADDAGVTPDSFWYGFDKAWDQISLALTFNQAKKMHKATEIAYERLLEIQEMANKNDTISMQKAQEEYTKSSKIVNNLFSKAKPENVEEFVVTFDAHYKKIDELSQKIETGNKNDSNSAVNRAKQFLIQINAKKQDFNFQKQKDDNQTIDDQTSDAQNIDNLQRDEHEVILNDGQLEIYLKYNPEIEFDELIVSFSKYRLFSQKNNVYGSITESQINLMNSVKDPVLLTAEMLPSGNYSKIELYIDSVVAKTGSKSINIIIPGNKIIIQRQIELLPEGTLQIVHEMFLVNLGVGDFYDFISEENLIEYNPEDMPELLECVIDNQCPVGDICLNFKCTSPTLPTYGCNTDSDCVQGQQCIDNYCIQTDVLDNINDLPIACPNVPCHFDAKARTLNYDGFSSDTPTDYISAKYPYEFILSESAKVRIKFRYKLSSTSPRKQNNLNVKVDNRIGYDDFTSEDFYNKIQEGEFVTGITTSPYLSAGSHFINFDVFPIQDYFKLDWFSIDIEEHGEDGNEWDCKDAPDLLPDLIVTDITYEVIPEPTIRPNYINQKIYFYVKVKNIGDRTTANLTSLFWEKVLRRPCDHCFMTWLSSPVSDYGLGLQYGTTIGNPKILEPGEETVKPSGIFTYGYDRKDILKLDVTACADTDFSIRNAHNVMCEKNEDNNCLSKSFTFEFTKVNCQSDCTKGDGIIDKLCAGTNGCVSVQETVINNNNIDCDGKTIDQEYLMETTYCDQDNMIGKYKCVVKDNSVIVDKIEIYCDDGCEQGVCQGPKAECTCPICENGECMLDKMLDKNKIEIDYAFSSCCYDAAGTGGGHFRKLNRPKIKYDGEIFEYYNKYKEGGAWCVELYGSLPGGSWGSGNDEKATGYYIEGRDKQIFDENGNLRYVSDIHEFYLRQGEYVPGGVFFCDNIDPVVENECQQDCTKGGNIAYRECEGINGCLQVESSFIGDELVDCDRKIIKVSYPLVSDQCVDNKLRDKYYCQVGFDGGKVYPIGVRKSKYLNDDC